MYINIEKIIADLEIEGQKGNVGAFCSDLSLGKKRIEKLLDNIEIEDLSVYTASDEIDKLQDELHAEILRLLKEKGVQIEELSMFSSCNEQYVNACKYYFEWEVTGILSSFRDSMYYKKKDIEWMRKLLNTPFDAPAEERLQIYRDWNAYWGMRGNTEKAEYIPSYKSYKPGFRSSKGMNIDIEKIIENLSLSEKEAEIGTFWADLSIGTGAISHLLNTIEKNNMTIIDAKNRASHLQGVLRDKIFGILKERGFSIKVLWMSCIDDEEYVNQYPTFFEWLILGILNVPPSSGKYYLKEDIEWMRKLLNTPFDAPAEERLKIYHEWKTYWKMRTSMERHKALSATE